MLNDLLDVLVRIIEAGGTLVIFTGAVTAFTRFVLQGLRHRDPEIFVGVR